MGLSKMKGFKKRPVCGAAVEGILCLAMEEEGILPQKTYGDGLKAMLANAVQDVTVQQNNGHGGRKA